MQKHSWKWTILCGLSFVLSILAIFRFVSSRKLNQPLNEVANLAFDAMRLNDSNQLFHVILPEEVKASKFNEANFRSFLAWAREGVSDWQHKSKPYMELMGQGGTNFSLSKIVVGRGGQEAYVNINVYRTEDGPRVSVVPGMVMFGLVSRYGHKFADEPGVLRIYKSCMYGMQRERKNLELINVYGYAQDNNSKFDFVSWDDFVSFISSAVDRETKAKQTFGK